MVGPDKILGRLFDVLARRRRRRRMRNGLAKIHKKKHYLLTQSKDTTIRKGQSQDGGSAWEANNR